MRDQKQTSDKFNYLNGLIAETDTESFLKIANKARNDSVAIGKESISLTYFEANTLHQIIRQHQCRHFIELGSLTGFSALFILNALHPEGHLFCFEKDDKWIPFLQENLNSALKLENNTDKKYTLIQGDALEQLKSIKFNNEIDGFFIDANKSAYLEYLYMAEKILPSGGIIIADNVFLDGAVWGAASNRFSNKQIQVMKEFNQSIFNKDKFTSMVLDTTDGMILAIKK